MEDLPVKALIIGVSVFVTMMVLSAIIIYFNTAKTVADSVSDRIDIASVYDDIMKSDVFEDVITGVEVRSLINKYAGNTSVAINIVEISGQATSSYNNVNNAWLVTLNADARLISEQKLDLINPIWNCTVEKETVVVNSFNNTTKTILNVSLDVDKNEV